MHEEVAIFFELVSLLGAVLIVHVSQHCTAIDSEMRYVQGMIEYTYEMWLDQEEE